LCGKLIDGNPCPNNQSGGLKHWEDDILGDIRNMNVNNWEKVAQIRDRWKKVAERARTLHRL
jgi:hypothetical protein